MRVGVKFCGNCNPQIDTLAVLQRLKLQAAGIDFVSWDAPGTYDKLLVLNGCRVGCATRPAFSGPCVVATNEEVQHWPVAKAALVEAIVAALVELPDQ